MKKADAKISEIIAWLRASQMVEKEEYQNRQKELEAVCRPMIEKLRDAAVGKAKLGGCVGLRGEKEVAGPQAEAGTASTIEDLFDDLAML